MDTSRIIKGVVGGGRYTVTAPIVKEDYGLYLKIEGLELPSTYEVDFSNSEHNGTSVTMIGNADGVLIPSQFISSGKDVFAFLYHVGVDFGRTVYKFRIPNKLRPDRTDETPTPEEQSVIDQAINALNDAVAQTAQDVVDADASAQSASADADRAEEAKTDAQNFATQAEQSATDAQESASQALTYKTDAESAKTASQTAQGLAESARDDAQASATASAQSASASANSASQALSSAQSASASASSAQGYASQAQASAQTASAKASEASTSAQTASTKASEAAQSASQASASATASAQSASQSAQIKDDVESMVDDAQASASASAQSASASANSATTAQGYAQSASASAQSASGYASQAQTSANTASSKATEASGYASTASAKATEASQSASQALTYKTDAESAKTSAQTAQGLAESARDDAAQAKSDAEDARDEAQTLVDGISGKVEQIDQNTADIASLEADRYKPYAVDTASGAIASFSDGADDIPLKSLVVDINPIQDLHGQENPYPAGGGKNILPYATADTASKKGITWTKNSDGSISFSGTCSESASMDFSEFKLPPGDYLFSNVGSTFAYTGGNRPTVYIRDADNSLTLANFGFGQTTNGIHFSLTTETNIRFYVVFQTDNVVSGTLYPMIRLASVTDATFAPYENICPISGWTGMEIQRDGTNLWGGAISDSPSGKRVSGYGKTGGYPRLNKTIKPNVYTLSVICNLPSGTAQESWAKSNNIRVWFKSAIDNKWYDIASATTGALRESTSGGSVIFAWTVSPDISDTPTKFVSNPFKLTIPVSWIAIGFFKSGNYLEYTSIQLEVGNTASDIEPYNGQTIPINWQTEAGTVYGGHLDVLSGVLTVDMAMVDLGTLNWKYTAANNGVFYQDLPSDAKLLVGTAGSMCSMFAPTKGNDWQSLANGDYILRNGLNSIGRCCVAIRYDGYTVPTDFKTAVTGQTLVYKLAEPIEIQLTPNQINSLMGVNNVWADTGDTEVEYRADTKLYIEKLTQPEEDDMIADSAISEGQFFMIGNTLYRALANIASGATITVGTNAQRVSLADALNLVNA